jgi:hypothetical protein
MKFTKEFITGIRTKNFQLSIYQIAKMIKTGAIQVAPWNRDEIKKRKGNASELFETVRMKMCFGNLMGYVLGTIPDLEKWIPSVEFPLFLSDGGHRSRWLKAVLDGVAALLDGTKINLLTLEEQKEINDYLVMIHVCSHIDGAAELEDYAKLEYTRLNTMGVDLCAGEVLRAACDDADLRDVKEALEGAFEHRIKDPRARDKGLETFAAITAGLIGGPDHMTTKKDDVIGIEFDAEKKARAMELIADIKRIEDGVMNAFAGDEDAEALVKALYFDRAPSLASEGPVICALYEAESAEARSVVVITAVDAYVAALRNAMTPVAGEKKSAAIKRAKSIFKEFVARISADRPGSKARSFNKKRYMYGWGLLRSSIAPALVAPVAAAGGAGAAVLPRL